MRNLIKYLPLLMELVGPLSKVVDTESDREERVDAILEIAESLADMTETQVDDDIVDRIKQISETPEFWITIDKIYELFSDSDNPPSFGALQKDRSLDPATIILIVELAGLVIKLFRKDR